jgi:DNA-binding LacI/PurR family transcriptional regulator
MSTQPGVFTIPRRLSLSAQAAAAIQKAVQENVWQEFLPSERRLCEMFKVSRPTIRTALQQLAQEGLIEIHHGRRNRLLQVPKPEPEIQTRLVVLISHQPIAQMALTAYQGISEMRAYLAEQGFTTETFVCPSGSAATQRRKMETFLRQNRVLCCVLLSLSKELQEWFTASSVPALVLGSCHPEVKLPSLDVDYRSVCRHAAGLLSAKGHSRIAFLTPHSNAAGDLVSEEGFLQGLGQSNAPARTEGIIVRHNGTATNLTAKLDALFSSRHRPSALLVAKPRHVFFVVGYLLRHGIKVPADVSIIARDYDLHFEDVISHYRFEGESFAHRLSRLMLQMANKGFLQKEPNLIFPLFVDEGTIERYVRNLIN